MTSSPSIINNFMSDEDRLRLIEIIDDQEGTGNMYRNEYVDPEDDGRIMLWNSGHEEFWSIVKKYLKKITDQYDDDLHPHDVAMLKYYPGPGMKLHSDQDGPCAGKCKVTSVIYLNDDYRGGEVLFPAFEKAYKLKAGEVMHFPQQGSQWDHQIQKINSGTRYAVITCYTDDLSMLRDVHKDFRD